MLTVCLLLFVHAAVTVVLVNNFLKKRIFMYGLIKRISWLVIALASLCVGLKVCGIDVEMFFRIKRYDLMLRYIVGVCGAASLVMFFVERSLNLCCKK